MDDEQEDVNKMTDFINSQKSSFQEDNFQLEFEDFVSFKQECSDQELDDDNITEFHTENVTSHETVFTEEEHDIIQSCIDPELKRLLMLNRTKNLQLIKLHKKVQQLLIECEKEIDEKSATLKNLEAKHVNHSTFVWKLAAPYFKDKQFFSSPLNGDAMKKRKGNELSVYDLTPSPKWTPIEFDRLINAVKCNYNINRQNDIVSKMNILRSKMNILKSKMEHEEDDDEDKSLMEEILGFKEQLQQLKEDDQVPPLGSNQFINWYKVSETFLKDKHTPVECEAVWHMLIHPDINKSEWTDEENKCLEEIAKRYSYQKWDDIAEELNTSRTGFTTCLHYFSKLCDKFKKNKFTPEEDKYLLEVVDIYKIGNFIPWNKVVYHFTNRSRHQLYHRYTYFLSQNHVKRGKFSEAEDILLMILVNKFGRNFKKCAEYMPNRSQIQLKSRYNSNLQRHIRKGTFTAHDDQVIYEYAKEHGEKGWSELARQLNRCNAQIRQRYKLIKTFLKDNPDANMNDIPKRRHRYDELNGGQYNFLNYMAEQYRHTNEIPTLSSIEESLKAEMTAPTSSNSNPDKDELRLKNVDAMLTDIFSSSMKERESRSITDAYLNEATENVERVLRLLNVNLDIPKDLDCNIHFDNIDVEILERISKKGEVVQLEENRLVPPNFSTLVGLRSLIIKHKEYKSQKNKIVGIYKGSKGFTDGSTRQEILYHQELFSKRFDKLFDWGAILSLEKPNQLDVTTESSNQATGKRSSTEDNTIVKKRRISISVLKNLSHHPQLQLVNKDVVDNLIKKNVVKMLPLSGLDGVTKPVDKEPQLIVSNESDENTSQVSSYDNEGIDDVVTNDDLQDVETLNDMLEKMKSDRSNATICISEEYEAIEDDVHLLKEVLQYEKYTVKAESEC